MPAFTVVLHIFKGRCREPGEGGERKENPGRGAGVWEYLVFVEATATQTWGQSLSLPGVSTARLGIKPK